MRTSTYLLTANMYTRCGEMSCARTSMQIFAWKMQKKKKREKAANRPFHSFVLHMIQQAAQLFVLAACLLLKAE